MAPSIAAYFATLTGLLSDCEITDGVGQRLTIEEGFDRVRTAARETHAGGNKIMFVGNGGSAGIASHLAIDYSKNGQMRAMAFNDAAALTCLGNDLGYENVFAKQIEFHARPGDLLIAISSSGQSANILNAANQGRTAHCRVVTLSGFGEDNRLRRLGDTNFYIRSNGYGFVEIGHLALCHAILDFEMGWNGEV